MLKIRRRSGESGSAMVEVTLMAPWIFFLFIGILDLGFYTYQAICTQNAARAAAARTAVDEFSQTTALACSAVLAELNRVPNVVSLSTCAANAGAVDATHPVAVELKTLCGKDVDTTVITTCISAPPTNPLCADCAAGVDTKAASSQVAVTYQSIPMVPIPGILTNRMTLTRIAEMRIIVQ